MRLFAKGLCLRREILALRLEKLCPMVHVGSMKIERLDHLVLTVADIDHAIDFYTEVLGMEIVTFGEGRQALRFGNQKINLHQQGKEFEPKAKLPTPGSADLCFIVEGPLDRIVADLEAREVSIELGPVSRTGATGPIRSVYLRDPDKNLLELSSYS